MIELTEKIVEGVIKRNWLRYAAIGFEGYEKHGRGCVVLCILNPELDRIEDSKLAIQYMYQKLFEEGISKHAKTSVEKTLLQKMREYDPESQIVVQVVNPKTHDVFVLTFGNAEPSPPDAYEIIKDNPDLRFKDGREQVIKELKKYRPK